MVLPGLAPNRYCIRKVFFIKRKAEQIYVGFKFLFDLKHLFFANFICVYNISWSYPPHHPDPSHTLSLSFTPFFLITHWVQLMLPECAWGQGSPQEPEQLTGSHTLKEIDSCLSGSSATTNWGQLGKPLSVHAGMLIGSILHRSCAHNCSCWVHGYIAMLGLEDTISQRCSVCLP